MALSLDMLVETPNHNNVSFGQYAKSQAFVGFVIARVLYCLCPLTGALLGGAAAGSHAVRENISKHYKISSETQKTALLAASFFVSVLCIQIFTAPPISCLKGLVVMTYVHNMGEETTKKIWELKDKTIEKVKEYWPKKPV